MITPALVRETGTLSAKAPFDFQKSLRFTGDFSPMAGEQEITATTLTKAIAIDGYTVVFRLTDKGTLEAPEVAYELFSEQHLPSAVKQAVMNRISFFLSLNDDLKPFYEIAQQDEVFAPIVESLYGMHHVKFLTLFEAACWAVMTQRIAIPIAHNTKRAFVEAYGSKLEVDGKTYWAFPELQRMASVSQQELTAVIKNERRATYIANIIAALSTIEEQFLIQAPYDEAEAWLRSIKGIGEWSASFLLLRALGRTEKMLLNLKPFLAIVPRFYGPNVTMEQLAQRYGHEFGYWGIYLRTAE